MEEFYHIFSVYDYKGGELCSDVNLTKDRFLSHLQRKFENYFEDIFESGSYETELTDADYDNYENGTLSEDFYDKFLTVGNLKTYLSERSSEYAGGEGFVSEWYVSKDNKLESYYPSDKDFEIIIFNLK